VDGVELDLPRVRVQDLDLPEIGPGAPRLLHGLALDLLLAGVGAKIVTHA